MTSAPMAGVSMDHPANTAPAGGLPLSLMNDVSVVALAYRRVAPDCSLPGLFAIPLLHEVER